MNHTKHILNPKSLSTVQPCILAKANTWLFASCKTRFVTEKKSCVLAQASTWLLVACITHDF